MVESSESKTLERASSRSPLRFLVMADFGLTPGTTATVESSIEALLQDLGPEIEGVLTDHLATTKRGEARVTLRIHGFADFEPPGLLAGLEAANPWQEALETLQSMAAEASEEDMGIALPNEVVESLRGGGVLSSNEGANRVDTLLSQVQSGPAPQQRALAEVKRRLARQAAALSSRPWCSRVESAWRGLEFLHRRLVGTGANLEILSAPKDRCAELFFEQIFHREHQGESELPLSAVVLEYSFGRRPGDLDLLDHFARMGESLRVPFLGNVGAGFWGLQRLPLLAGLPDLEGRLQGPEYLKWNRFRDGEAALWLALVVNRLLLRDRWAEKAGVQKMSWSVPEREDEPLWGSGSWALAAALAQAYAESDLELPLTRIELKDLPVRSVGREPSKEKAFPLEVALPEQRIIELGRCGLVPLVGRRGEDRARFPLAPTFHRPRQYDSEEATRASFFAATLPHQVFAAVASYRLQQIAEELDLGLEDDEMREIFEQRLLDLFGAAGATIEGSTDDGGDSIPPVVIEIETPPERPESRVVTARLRPPFEICGGVADLILGTAVLVG